MPAFKLPKGYSLTPPESVQGVANTVPDKGYGGADISQAFDANGVHYVACNAWGPGDPSFRWRAFKRVGAKYVEVPLPFVATGRGEQDVQWFDGRSWGIAWTNETFQFDVIPGFVPFPSIPSIVRCLRGLTRGTVVAAGDDPLWSGDPLRIVQVLEYYGLIERAKLP